MIDVEALRARFPTLTRKVYFQNGGYGLLSLDAKAALEQYITDRLEHGSVWGDWAVRTERIREKFARLLNAAPDEIALVSSASAGINSIASAVSFDAGRDKVVVSNYEYPTSGQIWHAQASRGACVVHVEEGADGLIPLSHFEAAIDDSTRVVAISDVCYRTGAKLDVAGVVRIAHQHGAIVVLDCFQSAGVLHLDMRGLGVDVAISGTQKYLLGSSGLAFMYVNAPLIESLTPTVSGWHAQANPGAMDIFHNAPAPNARRFQQGTPAMPSLYTAEAGLDTILELGTRHIEAAVMALSGRCLDRLADAGIAVATPRIDAQRGPMVSILSPDAPALVRRLDEADIVTSSRENNVRVQFHAYNNDADVDRLVAVLEANRDLLLPVNPEK